jgi:hypothetical protein
VLSSATCKSVFRSKSEYATAWTTPKLTSSVRWYLQSISLRLTCTAVKAARIMVPVSSAELFQDAIDLLRLGLRVKLST